MLRLLDPCILTDAHSFLVQSETDADKSYRVTITPYTMTCACPDFLRGRLSDTSYWCKHIDFAHENWPEADHFADLRHDYTAPSEQGALVRVSEGGEAIIVGPAEFRVTSLPS